MVGRSINVSVPQHIFVSAPTLLSVTAPANGAIYNWYTQASGGATVNTGTSYNFIATAPQGASFPYTHNLYVAEARTGTPACESANRAATSVVVYEKPVITASGNLTSGAGVTLTVQSCYVKYLWYRNGVAIPANNLNTITVRRAGTYTVLVYPSTSIYSYSFPDSPVEVTGGFVYEPSGSVVGTRNAQIQNVYKTPGNKTIIQSPTVTNNQLNQAITYFDGLGRIEQTVFTQAATNYKDIVTIAQYDAEGRQQRGYLPFTNFNSSGAYVANAVQAQDAFYKAPPAGIASISATGIAYTESMFDKSPLSRVLEQAEPGENWKLGSANTVKPRYLVNATEDKVPMVTFNIATDQATWAGAFYSQGELATQNATGAHASFVHVFADKSGRKILERMLITNGFAIPAGQLRSDFENVMATAIGATFDLAKYYQALEMAKYSWALPTQDPAGAFTYFQNPANRPSGYAHFEGIISGAYWHLVNGQVDSKPEGAPTTLGRNWLNAASNTFSSASSTTGAGDWSEILYVYDELNRLRVMLQPMGVKLLREGTPLTTLLTNYAYRYTYDANDVNGRMIARKTPTREWDYVVYNRLGLPTLTQIGSQRTDNVWTLLEYDIQNRPIRTRQIKPRQMPADPRPIGPTRDVIGSPSFVTINDYTRAEWQAMQDTQLVFIERRRTSVGEAYTDEAWPVMGTPLTETYYDDYDFNRDGAPDVTYTTDTAFAMPQLAATALGRSTGVRATVLDNLTGTEPANMSTPTRLLSVYFYDVFGRIVQTNTDLLDGGREITWNAYNFEGRLLKTKTRQQFAGETNWICKQYAYDHADRRIRLFVQTGSTANDNKTATVDYYYNELGQLTEKFMGSQSIDYRYHIRGWLKTINKPEAMTTEQGSIMPEFFIGAIGSSYLRDGFAEEYFYDEANPVDGTPARFDGKVAWARYSDEVKGVNGQVLNNTYEYDKQGRLLAANNYSQQVFPNGTWTGVAAYGHYAEKGLSYDHNSNLRSMIRTYGNKWVDNLRYQYTGNDMLANVADITDNRDVNMESDFRPNPSYSLLSQLAMTYDMDGYITLDQHRKIRLYYNYSNKIVKMEKLDGSVVVQYVYDALGRRLKRTRTVGSQSADNFSFGDFSYGTGNNASRYVLFEEGQMAFRRIDKYGKYGPAISREAGPVYYIRDRMGSVRATIDHSTSISSPVLTCTHYYAFGITNPQYSTTYTPGYDFIDFSFQGAEQMEDMPEVYWNNHGNRLADIQVGRWNGVDMLAEQDAVFTPFAYMGNDPVNYTDRQGLAREKLQDPEFYYDWDLKMYVSNGGGFSNADGGSMAMQIISGGGMVAFSLGGGAQAYYLAASFAQSINVGLYGSNGTLVGSGTMNGLQWFVASSNGVGSVNNFSFSSSFLATNISASSDAASSCFTTEPLFLQQSTDPEKFRMDLANKALRYLGSTNWNQSERKGIFLWNSNKCNLFVADCIEETGAELVKPNIGPNGMKLTVLVYTVTGTFSNFFFTPPTARQWADITFDIPGFRVLSNNEAPDIGDIVAKDYRTSSDMGFTGHVGIVFFPGVTIGTSDRAGSISMSDFGFSMDRSDYVFRRYTGR